MADRKKLVEIRQAVSQNRKRWIVVAGIAAVAVLVAVLVLVTAGAPENDAPPTGEVLAVVNGEQITAEEVSTVQMRMLQWDGVRLEKEQVLEQLISQALIFREAEEKGLVPTIEETEEELLATMPKGMTAEELRQIWREQGIIYDQYLEQHRVTLAINRFLDATIEVPEPTEEELREFYEGYREYHRQRSPDEDPPTFEEMRSTIVTVVEEQKRQEATSVLIQELRDQADIQYMEPEQ